MKKNLSSFIKNNRYFLVPYFLFLTITPVTLFFFGKYNTHIIINNYNNLILDYFFKYITHLGDGLFILIFCLSFLFIKYKYFLSLSISAIISGTIAQILKRLIFNDSPRPLKYFYNKETLHLIDGIDIHTDFSFPSGHTTIAFCVYFLFSIYIKNKYLKFSLFIISFLIAYSRMYLSQHFLIDIYAGSLIGVITAIFSWMLFEKINSKKLNNNIQLKSGRFFTKTK